ncbi:hypothetical protein GP486_002434 [Trichoglossum hirsutum]|uniref:Uncharacterized protein n=1 Tax=Trichoglossum hirsutum TaxID=265104 RepID=A0A9P8RRQ1_9PEZI|nr:hypothetical protein GP486_002434 [Trichoglossum hirsutum]
MFSRSRSMVSRVRRKCGLAIARLKTILRIPQVPTNLNNVVTWKAELTMASSNCRKSEPASTRAPDDAPLESELENNHFTLDVEIHRAGGHGDKISYRAQLDTGADANVMASNVRRALGYTLEPYDRSLDLITSASVRPLGVVRGVAFNFVNSAKTYDDEEFLVLDTERVDVLISRPFIARHRILRISLEE